MQITGDLSINQVWDLHHKENRTKTESEAYYQTRRENPELDRALYDYDKAKILGEMDIAEIIAKKLILGDALTEEQEKLMENQKPELLEKAKKIRSEAADIQKEFYSAPTKEDKLSVLVREMKALKGNDDEEYVSLKSSYINKLRETLATSNLDRYI